MPKSEVYSWRLSPDLKERLEEAARREGTSMAEILKRTAEDWLDGRADGDAEEERQARLRAAAMRFVGTIAGGRPDRSQSARADLRSRLAASRQR